MEFALSNLRTVLVSAEVVGTEAARHVDQQPDATIINWAATFIQTSVQRAEELVAFRTMKEDYDQLVLWLRDNRQQQISDGLHNNKTLAQVIIEYLNEADSRSGGGSGSQGRPN